MMEKVKWPKDRIIKALQHIYNTYGQFTKTELRTKFYKKGLICSKDMICYVFGSINNALNSANIKTCKCKYSSRLIWSKEKLIKILKKEFKDKKINRCDIDRLHIEGKLPHQEVVKQRLGGGIKYIAKLINAEYKKPVKIKWTKNKIINQLTYIYNTFGAFKITDINNIYLHKGLICHTTTIKNKVGGFKYITREYKIPFLKPLTREGPNEKDILDNLESKHNIKILRQYKIGRYYVDGYCKEKNTVYEVYEKCHSSPSSIIRDKKRMAEIISRTNCDFNIIKDGWQ